MRKALAQRFLEVRERIKKNPYRWMAGGFLLGFGGYMLIWFGVGWWSARPIYPVKNADGTIDYTLISDIFDSEKYRNRHVQEKWVLRFPNDVPVYVPELDAYASSDVTVGGVNLGNNSIGNRRIAIYYELDNNEFKHTTGKNYLNSARVGITATYLPYERYRGEKLSASFLEDYYVNYYIYCDKGSKIAEGVYKLRQSNQADIERKIREFNKISVGKITTGRKSQCLNEEFKEKYIILNKDAKPVAFARCRDSNSCSLEFPSAQDRWVYVTFYNERYIPALKRLYEHVISTLNQATVLDKSEIDWRPEQ